jgi:hypothetical protein
MAWNNRILAHEHEGEVYFQIHEVHYDEQGVPNMYTEKPVSVGGESIESIEWTLGHMKQAIEKPILLINGFPKEYNKSR